MWKSSTQRILAFNGVKILTIVFSFYSINFYHCIFFSFDLIMCSCSNQRLIAYAGVRIWIVVLCYVKQFNPEDTCLRWGDNFYHCVFLLFDFIMCSCSNPRLIAYAGVRIWIVVLCYVKQFNPEDTCLRWGDNFYHCVFLLFDFIMCSCSNQRRIAYNGVRIFFVLFDNMNFLKLEAHCLQ